MINEEISIIFAINDVENTIEALDNIQTYIDYSHHYTFSIEDDYRFYKTVLQILKNRK